VTVRQLEWYLKERRGCGVSGVVSDAGVARGGINCSEGSVISGLRSDVDANCALLGSCAASSGNSLPRFWDNLSVPSSGVNNPSSAVKVPRQRPLILLVILAWGLSKALASEEGKVMRNGLCCSYAAAEWHRTFALKSEVQ
jgi:hypothetical protein